MKHKGSFSREIITILTLKYHIHYINKRKTESPLQKKTDADADDIF